MLKPATMLNSLFISNNFFEEIISHDNKDTLFLLSYLYTFYFFFFPSCIGQDL